MKNRLTIALTLFLLLSTYKIQDKFNFNSILNIKKITIENTEILNAIKIKKDLSFLYETNLFLLKTEKIKEKLNKLNLVESFEIKKIYPNSLKIKIFEKKPIAILFDKGKKFYLSENIDLINFVENEKIKNLPVIFGNEKEFKIFYKNLKRVDFPIKIIKKYYFYEAKRWDLEIIEKKIIKLPVKNYNESLENFISLISKKDFEKYKIFDYRIKNQLILK